ncbi:hypothetical protein D9756_001281 [Leucocoprinus leucothites]|uniref:Uncharacterized protein n=1 Tax=Leucocoprinus leucothites TaxID=201217 RepID=A0A8H5G471_9AGAR|nr:hypothetical protein D9756_001281 [Leucoagaricus leucothites]
MSAVSAFITHSSSTSFTSNPASASSSYVPHFVTSSPANKRATAGAIAGGVIGVVACIAIIGIVYWFYFRRPRYRSRVIDLLGSPENKPIPLRNEVHDKPPTLTYTLPSAPPPVHTLTMLSAARPKPSPSASIGVDSIFPYSPESRTRPLQPSRLQITNPDPHSVNQLRSARQAEIKRQISTLREEIGDLTADLKSLKSTSSSGDQFRSEEDFDKTSSSSYGNTSHRTTPTPELRAQIQVLAEQVALLQAQQSSPWAQGLTLEPPPNYSPDGTLTSGLQFVPDSKSQV